MCYIPWGRHCLLYTSGSDEGDCAQEWFERCGYGMNSEKTFLRYILEEGDDVEFLLNGLENIKKSKELIQTLKEDLQKEIDRQRENPEYQYEWEEEDKECIQTEQEELDATIPVSYTHLDVYKRQAGRFCKR